MTIIADIEVQVGQEASDAWGTEVTPTVKLMGVSEVEIVPLVDVQQIEELRGTRVPAYHSLVYTVGGEGSLSSLLSYDDLPYWLQGMFGEVVATSDTSGWLHAFDAPVESSDSENSTSYTIAKGDGTNIYSLKGATVNTITISGESGAPAEISVEFIGKFVSTDVFAALSDRTVTYVMGDHIALYIDAGSDAVGGTLASDIGWSFELVMEANREVKRHLGDLQPGSYREAKMSGTLSLSLEHDSLSEAYLVEMLGATTEGVTKNVRIYAVDANGYSMTVDFSGVLSGEPAMFTDVDGVVSMDLELMGQKTSGASDWLSIDVINNVETLA